MSSEDLSGANNCDNCPRVFYSHFNTSQAACVKMQPKCGINFDSKLEAAVFLLSLSAFILLCYFSYCSEPDSCFLLSVVFRAARDIKLKIWNWLKTFGYSVLRRISRRADEIKRRKEKKTKKKIKSGFHVDKPKVNSSRSTD